MPRKSFSDGKYRALVQIRHQIGVDELTIIAAHLLGNQTTSRLTKKKVEDELRSRLKTEGLTGISAIDERNAVRDQEAWTRLKTRAREHVLNLYPEFV